MAKYRKLGMSSSHRQAMFKNLTADILVNGSATTTLARAKEIRPMVAKMITLGKRGDLHARRQAMNYLKNKEAVYKLFEEIAPGYEDRNGGYTRIYKLGHRRGDHAPIAKIELV